MQRIVETIFNVVIILIVALVGTAIGYYSAGYMPKRDTAAAASSATAQPKAVETASAEAQAKAEPVRAQPLPVQPAMPMQKEPLALAGPLGSALIPPPTETVALGSRATPPAAIRAEPAPRNEPAPPKPTVTARYNACLQQAERAFTVAWDATCKTSEAERDKKYQQCLSGHHLTKLACERAYRHVSAKNCKLPPGISDRLSAELQSKASRCLHEFRAAAAG